MEKYYIINSFVYEVNKENEKNYFSKRIKKNIFVISVDFVIPCHSPRFGFAKKKCETPCKANINKRVKEDGI